MIRKNIQLTEEEQEENQRIILSMLRQGISQAEIAREIGMSAQYVCNSKKNYIEHNLITQEEIDEAKERVKKEKEKNKQRENKLLKKKQETLNKLEKLINENKGITKIQIMEKLDISRTTLERYIQELVATNRINENYIGSARENNKKMANERNKKIQEYFKENPSASYDEIANLFNISTGLVYFIVNEKYDEMNKKRTTPKKKDVIIEKQNAKLEKNEQEILNYLEKGYPYKFISDKMKITQSNLMKIVNKLKKMKVISSEIIKKARDDKRENDEEKILEYLKKGFNQSAIIKIKPEYNVGSLSRIVTKLKEKNLITDEEIKKAQSHEEEKKRLKELVLSGMKKGYTVKEIIESDDTHYATERRVRDMKQKILEDRGISKNIYEIKHSEHQQEIKAEENTKLEKEIISMIKEGYTPLEISKYFYCTRLFIYEKQQIIFKKGILKKEDIKKYRIERKEMYKKIKQLAYIENERDGKRCTSRNKLFEIAQKELRCGNEIEDDVLDILANSLIFQDKLLSREHIKLVVMEYIKRGDIKKIRKYLDKLDMLYFDTKYGKSIEHFKEFAEEKLIWSKLDDLNDKMATKSSAKKVRKNNDKEETNKFEEVKVDTDTNDDNMEVDIKQSEDIKENTTELQQVKQDSDDKEEFLYLENIYRLLNRLEKYKPVAYLKMQIANEENQREAIKSWDSLEILIDKLNDCLNVVKNKNLDESSKNEAKKLLQSMSKKFKLLEAKEEHIL